MISNLDLPSQSAISKKLIRSCFPVTGIFGSEQNALFVTHFENDIYKPELRDFQPRIWEKLSENKDRYCLSLS